MFFFSGVDANENLIISSESEEKGNLYLGSIKSPKNKEFLEKKKIKYCLTVLQKKLSFFEDLKKLEIEQTIIEADDIPSFNILPFLDDAADFIHDSLNKGNVLVHCGSGISRSATCVIAYFIKYKKCDMEKAWTIVKEKRSFVFPNRGFQKQLKRFEEKCNI
jgi:hypothetical protein